MRIELRLLLPPQMQVEQWPVVLAEQIGMPMAEQPYRYQKQMPQQLAVR